MLAVPVSRSVRRALATAVLLDLFPFLREHPDIGPCTAILARRLDDLAYGAGLWSGAFRRSARFLAIRHPQQGTNALRLNKAAINLLARIVGATE